MKYFLYIVFIYYVRDIQMYKNKNIYQMRV